MTSRAPRAGTTPRASCFNVENATTTMALARCGQEMSTRPASHARFVLRVGKSCPLGRVDEGDPLVGNVWVA
eukprot:61412-Lingulodinium_polyedra.AAC.1